MYSSQSADFPHSVPTMHALVCTQCSHPTASGGGATDSATPPHVSPHSDSQWVTRHALRAEIGAALPEATGLS
jgi:hypothetical protein